MSLPRSRNVPSNKVSGAQTKKPIANEADQAHKKVQGRTKKISSFNRSTGRKVARVPERLSVNDEKIGNFAVEPAVNQASLPLTSLCRLPVAENHDLMQPHLQSSLPLLDAIDSLKLCKDPLFGKKQFVENILTKTQGCISSISLDKKIFNDLKPIRVNSEVIDKEFHIYSSSAAGNAPVAVNFQKGKDAGHLQYPFNLTQKHLIELSPFSQFTALYGIKLYADATLPANCCVEVAMKDLY